jgi:hypothetical protein
MKRPYDLSNWRVRWRKYILQWEYLMLMIQPIYIFNETSFDWNYQAHTKTKRHSAWRPAGKNAITQFFRSVPASTSLNGQSPCRNAWIIPDCCSFDKSSRVLDPLRHNTEPSSKSEAEGGSSNRRCPGIVPLRLSPEDTEALGLMAEYVKGDQDSKSSGFIKTLSYLGGCQEILWQILIAWRSTSRQRYVCACTVGWTRVFVAVLCSCFYAPPTNLDWHCEFGVHHYQGGRSPGYHMPPDGPSYWITELLIFE